VVIDVFAKKSFQLKPSAQGLMKQVVLLRRRRVSTGTKTLEGENNGYKSPFSRPSTLF
jgi:hypothetical protein